MKSKQILKMITMFGQIINISLCHYMFIYFVVNFFYMLIYFVVIFLLYNLKKKDLSIKTFFSLLKNNFYFYLQIC